MTGKVTPESVQADASGARELLRLARNIERMGAQRRKLLAKVGELEGRILEAKRLFRQLTDSLLTERAFPKPDDAPEVG